MLIVTLRSKEDPELFNTVYNATKVEAGFLPGKGGLHWIVEDDDSVIAKPVSGWRIETEIG